MSAEFTSRLPEFQARHEKAIDAALVAAALVVENQVKRGLTRGYTTGKHVTGRVRSSVTHSEPMTEDGMRVIRIGTNVEYALYWELGWSHKAGSYTIHVGSAWGKANMRRRVVMRGPYRFWRKEVWRPAMTATADKQSATFNAVYKAMMAKGQTPTPPAGGAP